MSTPWLGAEITVFFVVRLIRKLRQVQRLRCLNHPAIRVATCGAGSNFGGLIYLLCDEVGVADWVAALQQLVDLITAVAKKAGKKITALIQNPIVTGLGNLS